MSGGGDSTHFYGETMESTPDRCVFKRFYLIKNYRQTFKEEASLNFGSDSVTSFLMQLAMGEVIA